MVALTMQIVSSECSVVNRIFKVYHVKKRYVAKLPPRIAIYPKALLHCLQQFQSMQLNPYRDKHLSLEQSEALAKDNPECSKNVARTY